MHVILTPHYPPRRYGGVEKVVQQLARGLRDAGERVVVGALSLDEDSSIDADGDIPIIRVCCSAATKEGRTATILAAQDALVEAVLPFIDDDAVVHAHDWFVAPAAIALRDRLGARLVAFIHSVKRAEVDRLHERHQRIHDLQCLLAREADAVLAATAVSRRTIETHLGVPQHRVTLLPLGIDENAGGPIDTGEKRILYLGRLQPEKGIDTLAEAFREAAVPDAILRILGRGPLLPAGPRIVLLPFTSDAAVIDEELRRAAMLVVPSRFEAAGMVVLEAMCRETPVIVSRCGGPDEIVRDGVTGRTFAPGDSAGLARLLRLAFERWEETRAMAVAGRLDVERRYRWSSAVDTLLGVCTGTPSPRRG